MLQHLATGAGVLLLGVLGVTGAASAATAGYPPPTIGATSCSTSEVIGVGGSATIDVSCAFKPGAAITITLNGDFYGTAIAPSSGTFVETFRVTDPHISLNGNTEAAVGYGTTNTFVASGLNSAGDANVATTLVTIPSAPTTSSSTGLAFTGMDIMALVIASFALMALGFLVLVFSRRRNPSPSV
jgi:hypothetical protein